MTPHTMEQKTAHSTGRRTRSIAVSIFFLCCILCYNNEGYYLITYVSDLIRITCQFIVTFNIYPVIR